MPEFEKGTVIGERYHPKADLGQERIGNPGTFLGIGDLGQHQDGEISDLGIATGHHFYFLRVVISSSKHGVMNIWIVNLI
ncbi:MAG: hypothetical protein KAT29_10030 [Anaerolineales bacterium]|nr:hypothetical protein [Anaerolineales bacterium]